MSVHRLVNSFKDAGKGLKQVYKSEQNFRLQIFVGILIVIALLYFPVKAWETILVILLIVLVLVMELLNTALEYIADLLKPRLHHYVFAIKNIMAAAVLLSSLGALIIGLIIFLPHLVNLFTRYQ